MMTSTRRCRSLVAAIAVAGLAGAAAAQDSKLRLIAWADYVPADVVAQFKKETGIDVEVTLSNNEEILMDAIRKALGNAPVREQS